MAKVAQTTTVRSRDEFPYADRETTLRHLVEFIKRYAPQDSRPVTEMSLSQWTTDITLGEEYFVDVKVMFQLRDEGYVVAEHGPFNDITFRFTEKLAEMAQGEVA